MAKGDDSRSRNQIDWQGNLSQNHLDNLRRDTIVPQNQQFWNNYLTSVGQDQQAFGDIMSQFSGLANAGLDPEGFSPEDLSSMRSRAVSPIRGIYQRASSEIDRQRALQGGYSPNYTAAKAKMAREQSQGVADAMTNVEAEIAGMKQMDLQQRRQLQLQRQQSGAGGMGQLYSSTPGRSSMFGNQVMGSTNQQLEMAGLQNQLGLGRMNATNQAAQIPGKWENTMGRIRDIADLGTGMWSGFGIGGGGGNLGPAPPGSTGWSTRP